MEKGTRAPQPPAPRPPERPPAVVWICLVIGLGFTLLWHLVRTRPEIIGNDGARIGLALAGFALALVGLAVWLRKR